MKKAIINLWLILRDQDINKTTELEGEIYYLLTKHPLLQEELNNQS